MDNEDIPPFDGTPNTQAPTYSAVAQQVRLRQIQQAISFEIPRTPPMKAVNVEQLTITPRSVPRRPIKIVAPTEPKNGLSALAAPFVPSIPPPAEAYKNKISGVPSHWVPLYGSALGLFYDPVTDMFVGDGPPRHSIHRPWDGSLPSAPLMRTEFESYNEGPQARFDSRHVQSRAFTGRYEEPHLTQGETRFYCFCTEDWLAFPHKCHLTAFTRPIEPARVPPRGWLPYSWTFRDNVVTERNYLFDMDMHQFANVKSGAYASIRALGHLSNGDSESDNGSRCDSHSQTRKTPMQKKLEHTIRNFHVREGTKRSGSDSSDSSKVTFYTASQGDGSDSASADSSNASNYTPT